MGELVDEVLWSALPGVSRQDYLEAALEAMARVFRCDSLGWNNLDFHTGLGEVVGKPVEVFGPQTQATTDAMMRISDHPMILSYIAEPSDTSPRRMSDVVSESDLRRTEAYQELLHPWESEYQFTIVTRSDGAGAGSCWTFSRRLHDFSDEDVDLAARIQPLLSLIERTWGVNEPPSDVEADLTQREISVLALLAHGLTARAIGSRLGISPFTVNKHLEHIYRKLDANDRLVAVAKARHLGLVAP